ncbi:LacI family transcriptional regulator [Alicyclobacillus tolerans]|uniref:LacI family DNA-binding transcriptional regulator n=1 Tax=Alicyclobacillus tolerans TaxID=90970 RepID=UPI001F2C2243|nr:LacI family DNA-binding transcriptional regulator [Alicyclobacillus tolerans]MCF8565572.1 LacI family transcriptional regulator [Alicyclobacillus tolerans]
MNTIRDVAKLAGVSVGTVSKVMNHQGNVKPELQDKVLQAVKALNYQANGIARSLRSSSTKTLAVLLADIMNPFQMALARGIEEVTYQHGYHILISSTKENPEIEHRNLRMFYEKRVDGLILCTTGRVNDDIRSIIQREIPVVLVDRPVLSLPVDIVADNNLLGMEMLVACLKDLGHHRIGIVHGNRDTIHGQLRYEGVVKALQIHGIPFVPELQVDGGFTYEGGYAAVQEFLNRGPLPTAFVSANNNMTAGILRACRDLGIKIPDDVSLVSFGDLEYSWNLITPSVTAVTQSPVMIGKKAAELILRRLTGQAEQDVSHIFMTPRLIVRESTAAV